jgi:CHAT domain-containing protein
MPAYDEFKLLIRPDVASAGRNWTVEIRAAPVKKLVGTQDTVTPQFTREQLLRLRTPSGWANRDRLREIGDSVWKSLTDTKVETAFLACLEQAKQNERGLRIVIATTDHQNAAADADAIRLSELPVEAMRREPWNFLAPSISTPVSRSLQIEGDAELEELTLPLRALVVIASPKGLPKADIATEEASIKEAFKPLVESGGVDLDILTGATGKKLQEHLERQFHVVHFVAHGNFDMADSDPSTRAFISLQKDDGDIAPIDGEQLDLLLRDT